MLLPIGFKFVPIFFKKSAYSNCQQQWLNEGRYNGVGELAKAVGKARAIVTHTLQLALLSPEIIHMAIVGTLPSHISFKNFKAGLPADWTEQKRFLGLL